MITIFKDNYSRRSKTLQKICYDVNIKLSGRVCLDTDAY